MSLHNLRANVDRYTHHEAQEFQKAQMAAQALARKEFGVKLQKSGEGGDNAKAALHKGAQRVRGPHDELVDANDWLSAQAESEGVYPEDNELKEYEDYYLRKLKVRPQDELRTRKVKRLARNRWTIDTIYQDCGFHLPGPKAARAPGGSMPTVQAVMPIGGQKGAFVTSTTQVIFPFYYAAAIQAGILAMPLIDRLIMEDIPVDSHTVDHAMMTEVTGDRLTALSSEGASGNEVIIRGDKHPITLQKFKSKALADYESVRLQRVPLFERGLMRVGQQFMIQVTESGMDTLINGDGTTTAPGGGAAPTYTANVAGSPVYLDMVKLETKFPQGYEIEDGVLVGDVSVLQNVFNMAEFKDPLSGWHYQRDGSYPTPMGHDLYRWDASATASGTTGGIGNYNTGSLLHVKSGIAMVKYTEGGLLVETDRLIDGQWNLVVSSTWTGYGIWDRKGVVVGVSFA